MDRYLIKDGVPGGQIKREEETNLKADLSDVVVKDDKLLVRNREAGFKFVQKKGDLFSCSDKESLAHCVSADLHMSKGIAVLFKQKFGGVHELTKQGQEPGGVAFLQRGGRFIYYLVTKKKYFNKPTYDSLRSSLIATKKHCVERDVKRVSMPRLGCGLDRLEWSRVCEMIQQVFLDTDITITVYTL